MKRSIFITLVLLIETIVVKLIIESTEKPALWMESITVSARSNRIGAFIFPLHRLQKQDSVELIEKDTDRKSNDHFIRITYTKIIDGTLFLILILMYAEMIYKIFLTDIPEPYEYLDVDE